MLFAPNLSQSNTTSIAFLLVVSFFLCSFVAKVRLELKIKRYHIQIDSTWIFSIAKN